MIYEILVGGVAVVGTAGIVTTGWVIGSYNTFVHAKQDVDNQFSNIKTEYQRRADLIMNLAESVKSYKKFEKETLVEVAQARGGNFGKTKKDQLKGLSSLDKTFARFLMVFEKYPKLKADEMYKELTAELKMTENRINVARTDYNAIVNDYNTLIMEFPKRILANAFGFNKEDYFENEQSTNTAPRISLD